MLQHVCPPDRFKRVLKPRPGVPKPGRGVPKLRVGVPKPRLRVPRPALRVPKPKLWVPNCPNGLTKFTAEGTCLSNHHVH